MPGSSAGPAPGELRRSAQRVDVVAELVGVPSREHVGRAHRDGPEELAPLPRQRAEPLAVLRQRRVVPDRRVQPGQVAHRVDRLVDAAPVDLHARSSGCEVVEQQHERAVVVADLGVPAARRTDLHPVAEHGVEADLVAVAAAHPFTLRTVAGRGLRHEGRWERAAGSRFGIQVQPEVRTGLAGPDLLHLDRPHMRVGRGGAQRGREPVGRDVVGPVDHPVRPASPTGSCRAPTSSCSRSRPWRRRSSAACRTRRPRAGTSSRRGGSRST